MFWHLSIIIIHVRYVPSWFGLSLYRYVDPASVLYPDAKATVLKPFFGIVACVS